VRRYTVGLLTLVLLACPLWAQAIKLPAEAKGEPGAFVKIPSETDGKEVRWYSPDKGLQVFPVELLRDSKTAVVTATAPGRYRLIAWTAKGDAPSDPAVCVVIIGDAPPVPPDPGPNPPKPPDPPQPPAPISGKRVLIVYETAEASKMPEKQQQILYGKTVRDYLNQKCDPDPDGKTKGWRIWDKDADPSGEAKVWQDAMKVERKGLPWLIVGNGKTGFSGPLPNNVDDFMKSVKQYLGD
jgi:hypothetical protein